MTLRCASGKWVSSQRGSGTALSIGMMAIVSIPVLIAAIFAGVVFQSHQLQISADAIALASAQVAQSGTDACKRAADLATESGVELVSCEQVGDHIDFAVRIEVSKKIVGREMKTTSFAGQLDQEE